MRARGVLHGVYKYSPWCLIVTLANVDQFWKLSLVDSLENSICIHHKDFHLTCDMLLHYLVKFENPKMLPNFHTEHDSWCVQQKFNARCYVNYHKNIVLMVLLKYVYNIQSIVFTQWRHCQDNHGEKITTMQQRSTGDSKCRLTIFKMLVGHSVSAVLRQSL